MLGWDEVLVDDEDGAEAERELLERTRRSRTRHRTPSTVGDCWEPCGGLYHFIDANISRAGEVWATSSDDCIDARA